MYVLFFLWVFVSLILSDDNCYFPFKVKYMNFSDFDQSYWVHFDPENWEKCKGEVFQKLDRIWGLKPSKVEMKPTLLKTEEMSDYTRYLYEIQVENTGMEQWDSLKFYFLKPKKPKAEKNPTMIVHHQHAGEYYLGKSEPVGIKGDAHQFIGLDLVKKGYSVIAHDALCFEERQQKDEKYVAMRLLLFGRTLNYKYIFDVQRLIDYLETRDDVDPNRIGIVGHSLGGQMSLYSGLADERIKVIIDNSGGAKIHGNNSILQHQIDHNYALYLPSIFADDGSIEFDFKEILGLIHLNRKPLLMSGGYKDHIFPILGVAESFNWVSELYKHYGDEDKLEILIHSAGHCIPPKNKEHWYAFLEKFL